MEALFGEANSRLYSLQVIYHGQKVYFKVKNGDR